MLLNSFLGVILAAGLRLEPWIRLGAARGLFHVIIPAGLSQEEQGDDQEPAQHPDGRTLVNCSLRK